MSGQWFNQLKEEIQGEGILGKDLGHVSLKILGEMSLHYFHTELSYSAQEFPVSTSVGKTGKPEDGLPNRSARPHGLGQEERKLRTEQWFIKYISENAQLAHEGATTGLGGPRSQSIPSEESGPSHS